MTATNIINPQAISKLYNLTLTYVLANTSVEDGLRCLGALLMEVQMLQKRSSNLKKHIHTNEQLSSIETLESEALKRVGRVDVLDA